MKRTSFALLCALAGGPALGCATAAAPPPAWFAQPPAHSPRTLYFVGDSALAADEEMARDLAMDKALHALSVHCGAEIKSDFRSREAEKNGVSDQEVELVVEVSGEPIDVRGARLARSEVRAASGGFDGYVLLEWPRSEYEAVLSAQKNRAARGLERFLAARAAAEARRFVEAGKALREAKQLTGGATVPLDHPEFKDSGVLRRAVESLGRELEQADAERKGVCAVAVRCEQDGKPSPCDAARRGVIEKALTSAGKKVAPAKISDDDVVRLLGAGGGAIELEGEVREAGCVVAVRYGTETMGKDDYGFHYVRYAARGVVYDVDGGRILATEEVPPTKKGHVNAQGAVRAGVDEAEKTLMASFEAKLRP